MQRLLSVTTAFLCIVCLVDETGSAVSLGSSSNNPLSDSSTLLYRIPILAASAENQSVQVVLTTASRNTYRPHDLLSTSPPQDSLIWVKGMSNWSNSMRLSSDHCRQQRDELDLDLDQNNAASYLKLTCDRSPFKSSELLISSTDPLLISVVYIGSCSSIYRLPVSALGVNYEVIAWSPVNQLSSTARASFTIASQLSDLERTTIYITLPPAPPNVSNSACNIRFGVAVRLECNVTIRMTLRGSESATFYSSDVDLSGTLIKASDMVAVYVANSDISIGPATSVLDSTASQLLPVSSWGTRFAVASIPDNSQSGYSVRVTSGGTNYVTLNVTSATNSTTTYQLEPRCALTLDFADNRNVYIVASAPVQVVQFVRGATVQTDFGAPASLVIPPVERFDSIYQFVNPAGYTDYITIVIAFEFRTGVMLNGVLVDPYGRRARSDIGGNSGLVSIAIQLTDAGSFVIEHQFGESFGIYRYSYIRGQCALAYPAGVRFVFPTNATKPSTSTSTAAPRPTEPSGVGCANDNMGTEFTLVFIENEDETSTNHLQIYPASFSRSSVDISVTLSEESPVGPWNRSFSLPTSSATPPVIVEVPRALELNGTGIWQKAIVVKAAKPIGLYGMSMAVSGSCDGFVALPTASFGSTYYTMSFSPTDSKSEIGIVAIEDNTMVNVTLNAVIRPTPNLVWQGERYRGADHNSTIVIDMDRYDTVQLQSDDDLTGTLIESNQPIGVFSGNNFKQNGFEDLVNPVHLVEQLPPTTDWGSIFYLIPFPNVSDGFTYKIVSSASDNRITILTSKSTVAENLLLSFPGNSVTLVQTDGQLITVTSDKPVLLAQFAGGTFNQNSAYITGHRAMQLIPPVERYRPWYTFSTEQGGILSNFVHYILIAIESSAVNGLFLDDLLIDPTTVTWTNFNASSSGNASANSMVGGTIEVETGVHIIRQKDNVPFGAYIFGYSTTSHCIYAYAAGMCVAT